MKPLYVGLDVSKASNVAFLMKPDGSKISSRYAGLTWTQHQSGQFEAEATHMIKSGSRYLRYYLLEAANSVRRYDSEYSRYYNLKYKEVNQFQHKRALALTVRKLIRLVYRLLKHNRLYTSPEGTISGQ